MDMRDFSNNAICQVAIIVRDIEKAAKTYSEVFGLPMPTINLTDPEEQAQTKYYGEPTPAQAKLAFFQMGALSLELIEPVGGPSTWQAFLDEHGEGVHHIAFMVNGMNQVVNFLDEKGMPTAQRGEYTGGRYAYIDSMPQLGVILELLENDHKGE
ncbi:MAG: VOC family protein [Armatimonadota bacterium]